MIGHLKHFGLFVIHSFIMTLHQFVGLISKMFPERPAQKEIDIEDDIDEPDDLIQSKRGNEVQRNKWGLPVIDEEE